ncbi:hypothetical protein Tcan_00210 [Toxocara canis]|uniref:Uncharacterized protein n=1 Tax=Toxocara canis TaxID=6265 RepID=A0A0B2VWS0_TOXCA|nr:hypothetical protein Tcan_00210 [Toxocara canis]
MTFTLNVSIHANLLCRFYFAYNCLLAVCEFCSDSIAINFHWLDEMFLQRRACTSTLFLLLFVVLLLQANGQLLSKRDFSDDEIDAERHLGKQNVQLRDLLNAGVSYGIRWGRR